MPTMKRWARKGFAMCNYSLLYNKDLTDKELRLLLMLLSRCNPSERDGALSCWPSNKRLAFDIGASKSRVRHVLYSLRDKGYIEMTHDEIRQGYEGRIITLNQSALDFSKEGPYCE